MSQSGWAMILFYGAAQGLFLAGALVSRQRGRRLSNVFLSGLVLINAMVVVYWLFVALDLTEFVAPIVYVSSIFLLGIGPEGIAVALVDLLNDHVFVTQKISKFGSEPEISRTDPGGAMLGSKRIDLCCERNRAFEDRAAPREKRSKRPRQKQERDDGGRRSNRDNGPSRQKPGVFHPGG